MNNTSPIPKPTTLRAVFLRAFIEAHRRRPASFYFLLVTPLVLLLGVPMFNYMEQPKRFVLILSMMFLFFGVMLAQATMDMMYIMRRHFREERQSFTETLGDTRFAGELGRKVGERRHDA